MTTDASTPKAPPSSSARWPHWVGFAAAGWSLIYGVLGVFWAFGGTLPPFPFGPGADPATWESNLGGLDARTGGIATAVIGLSGAVLGVLAARTATRARLPRTLLLGYALAAYVPIFAFFGVRWLLTGEGVDFAELGAWTIFGQAAAVAGGFLWLGTAVAYARRTRRASHGRTTTPRWLTAAAAERWGRWAVGVAVVVPLLYAATRWAWALGFRLGISEEFHREGARVGLWWAGAALATLAIGGALLTLGLAQRWGEVYPRLVWWRSGRPVPRMLAVVPASLVSVMVTTAGIEHWRLFLTSAAPLEESWATLGPELLWPLWGLALAAATLAYDVRRRPSSHREP